MGHGLGWRDFLMCKGVLLWGIGGLHDTRAFFNAYYAIPLMNLFCVQSFLVLSIHGLSLVTLSCL